MKRFHVIAFEKHFYHAEVEAESGEEALRKAVMEMNKDDFEDDDRREWWIDDRDEQPEEIISPPPSHWDEQPGHPVEDWRYEIANDDTRLGYLDWCAARDYEDLHDGRA